MRRFPSVAACLILLTLSRALPAAPVTLNPTADAFVSAANPHNNYGAAGGLAVSAPGLPKGEFQTLLRFNTATASTTFDTQFGPGNWTIQSVTLVLNATNPNNPIFNANAAGTFTASWMQNDTWLEGTGGPNAPTTDGITYNTLAGFLSPADASVGTFSYNGANTGASLFALTPNAAFLTDVSAGGDVTMRLAPADAAVSYLFTSRTLTNPAIRPGLVLTAIPEPTTFSILGLLIPLALRRTR